MQGNWMSPPVIGVVGSGAGGIEHLRGGLVEPLLSRGYTVAVTLTPTAYRWLESTSEIDSIAAATGFPVRSAPRLPSELSPHPTVSCYVIAPASANTVAKLALGIADSQALTGPCEALGTSTPIVVFPRINAAHAGHPMWEHHLATLRNGGANLIYGEEVWPLQTPRSNPHRALPWKAIIDAVAAVCRISSSYPDSLSG